MFLVLSITVKLQTGEISMLNWKQFTTTMVAFASYILQLVNLGGHISFSHDRIHRLQKITNSETGHEIHINLDATSMHQSAE